MDGQSIAADWREIDLGELATFRTGPFGSTFHKSDYVVGGTPLINPSHIIDGDIVPDETVTVRPELAKRLSVFALREGEIVIGRRGDMGRCAVVKRHHEGFLCGTGSMIVRPRLGTNPHLLQSLLSSPEIIAKIEENSVGTTMINLNQGTLSALKIRMAAEPKEQEAIAEALSDADALIEGLERLIAKKRLIKQGAMQDLLTAKRRLPGFSGEWTRAPLRQLCSQIQDGTHFTPTYVEYGTPFYSVENVTARNFDNCKYVTPEAHEAMAKRCRPTRGDILMTRIGSIGDTYLVDWDHEASIYVSLCLLRPGKSIDARYLYAYSRSSMFVKEVEERSLPNAIPKKINLGDIADVNISIPIDPTEQAEIASVLNDMDAEIQALEDRLEKARQVKEGMMQNLLTGRIRLL
ncbi:restriction endonuclease subunit S [Lentibacter sp. XHP0401]|nr:restriction endonuclease subunit S [Lentibacter sp. XHP0401]